MSCGVLNGFGISHYYHQYQEYDSAYDFINSADSEKIISGRTLSDGGSEIPGKQGEFGENIQKVVPDSEIQKREVNYES